eukprot:scaffold216_cov208-Chaetoceros_neogracile.AAC.5
MAVCCCCTGGSNLPDIFKESTVIVVPNGITFLTSSLSREREYVVPMRVKLGGVKYAPTR